jgi:hypothetical protein
MLLLQSAHEHAAALPVHWNLMTAAHSLRPPHAAAAAVRSAAATQELVLLVLLLLTMQELRHVAVALLSLPH